MNLYEMSLYNPLQSDKHKQSTGCNTGTPILHNLRRFKSPHPSKDPFIFQRKNYSPEIPHLPILFGANTLTAPSDISQIVRPFSSGKQFQISIVFLRSSRFHIRQSGGADLTHVSPFSFTRDPRFSFNDMVYRYVRTWSFDQ